jgi:hypothetical protein
MSLTFFPSPRAHPALNFESVQEAFGAHASSLEGQWITSAFDLFSVETLRDRLGLRNGRAVPADVFVWGQGEPKDRTLTKVGGLPYWVAETPWPEKDGKPLLFLAQFNFKDSEELVGDLPGEMLLIFTDEGFTWMSGEPSGLHIEWIRIGTKRLTVDRLVPKPKVPFFKGYGIIHRSADYPEAEEAARGATGVAQARNLPLLHGTKIGGVPAGGRVKIPKGGRFLAQLGSIQAASGVDYPWVNRPRPLGLTFDANGIYGETNQLMIGDMGSLSLFLKADGSVGWEVGSG